MQPDENKNKGNCLGGCLKVVGGGVGILVILMLVVIGAYILLRGLGSYLVYADDLEPAKVIVVLSGGTESRMTEALNLYEEGYGDIIILTETGEQTEGYDYLNSFDMRIQLMSNGVPSGNIVITNLTVNTTVDEAVAVRDLMRNRQYQSVIVVTDPYHTRRTAMIFNQVFADEDRQIIIRPVRSSWYSPKTWFMRTRGWEVTVLEYGKILSMKLGKAE